MTWLSLYLGQQLCSAGKKAKGILMCLVASLLLLDCTSIWMGDSAVTEDHG